MLQALAYDVLGRGRLAQQALASALTGSPEPDEYVRLFLDEGPPMLALLREAANAATHDGGAAAHAVRLLGVGAPPEPVPTEPVPTEPRPSRPVPSHPGEEPPSDVDPLSERELQVVRLLDSELTGPEIARALFISHNTLRTHTKHIFTKLGVTSRRGAVRRARDDGLI
jgi:LuxR family maltose regulon positive regulatory protein